MSFKQGWVTAKLALRRRRRRWRRLLIVVVGLVAGLEAAYLLKRRPDWAALQRQVPRSLVIQAYEADRRLDKSLARPRWYPVPLASIPERVHKAVIAAEDARFYQHAGVDWIALKDALIEAARTRRLRVGASTITQQTVKNLITGTERSLLRKWHDLVFAFWMERRLTKARILTLYLNVAELGEGIFGVEAAAKAYWNKSAGELTAEEAIELAATLPSPRRHNPATRTERFLARVEKVRGFVAEFGWAEAAPAAPAPAPEPPGATEDGVAQGAGP